MKKALLTIAATSAFLLWPALASAHTIDLCWRAEADGSTTFFAGIYHYQAAPQGGLVIDGTTHAFTGSVSDVPADVTACQKEACTGFFTPNHWFTVNVGGLPMAYHEISLTCLGEPECGWPFCYPIVEEVGDESGGDPELPPEEKCPCNDFIDDSSSGEGDNDLESISDDDSNSVSDSQSDSSDDPGDIFSDSISIDGCPSISLSDYENCTLDEGGGNAIPSADRSDDERFNHGTVSSAQVEGGCQTAGSGGAAWFVLLGLIGLAWVRRRD